MSVLNYRLQHHEVGPTFYLYLPTFIFNKPMNKGYFNADQQTKKSLNQRILAVCPWKYSSVRDLKY